MNKLISFAIPCYNSAAYMEKCVQSILDTGSDEVEILIIDDGSFKDNTLEIAQRLECQHPGIVRAIHQENGGHGEAVNTGIANATGKYFKVVDSDDWVDPDVVNAVIRILKYEFDHGEEIDMFLTDFIYDKVGQEHKKVMKYLNLPKNRVFTWDDTGLFIKGEYILMHSVIYRTEVLKKCKLHLPAHTFYVDNIYVFNPLPLVKKMYYLDATLYHYFIGRNDQSVNEEVMIGRIDQQIKVNKLMLKTYMSLGKCHSKAKKYMFNYLEIITVVTTILLYKSGTPANERKRKELWDYISFLDPTLYKRLRYGLLCGMTNLPGRVGRRVSIISYTVAQKIVGFN